MALCPPFPSLYSNWRLWYSHNLILLINPSKWHANLTSSNPWCLSCATVCLVCLVVFVNACVQCRDAAVHMGTRLWKATLQVPAVWAPAPEPSAQPQHSRKAKARRERERLRETSTQATGQTFRKISVYALLKTNICPFLRCEIFSLVCTGSCSTLFCFIFWSSLGCTWFVSCSWSACFSTFLSSTMWVESKPFHTCRLSSCWPPTWMAKMKKIREPWMTCLHSSLLSLACTRR